MSLPFTFIILGILVIISFFISVSETAIISLSKIRLRHMVANGIKHAKTVHSLVTRLDKFITAILISNNFVNILMSAIVTAFFVQALGVQLGVFAATFVSAFFILILCEITPKILAIKHTERIALFAAPIWDIFVRIFQPGISFFTGISNFILRILGVKPGKRSPLITEEELRLMIEVGKEEGVLSDEERKMLHRIFEFGDIRVRDVMAPIEKMVAVDIKSSPDELLNIFVEEGHARLPVFDSSRDNIVGIIYARDMLYVLRDKGLFLLQDLIRPPYFISGQMRVNEVLRRFQAEKMQIAIVAGEDKKALGLVTLEDLVEEIVGEIEEDRSRRKNKK